MDRIGPRVAAGGGLGWGRERKAAHGAQSRHDARRQLASDVRRLGAEGVVIATMQMHVRERDCPVTAGRRDHIVEATLIGTAVARFSRAGPRHDGPALPIMSLGPQRRQAAVYM